MGRLDLCSSDDTDVCVVLCCMTTASTRVPSYVVERGGDASSLANESWTLYTEETKHMNIPGLQTENRASKSGYHSIRVPAAQARLIRRNRVRRETRVPLDVMGGPSLLRLSRTNGFVAVSAL
ncbi:hypothetical protein BV898_19048 [Hypsibius exemplaris]|uniref:Uncharacterized protein n=1 Tax=Hypsibius exemplaris TaxID=2072580 RepID=A0A9X6RNK2_HYPEX|nr:hypothetical protein BV898_19048 [Hypsibius exemplaris]